MHVGTLLARLRREGDAQLALAALADSRLLTEVEKTGARFDETPAQYVASAASRFASRASHEEWLQLMSSIERSSDAGHSLLSVVVRWALREDHRSLETEHGCKQENAG